MSLLGCPVYANTSTPLWLSVSGDTITGDLSLVDPAALTFVDGSGNTTARIVSVPPVPPSTDSTLYIQSDSEIAFSQIGVSSANTRLSIDAFGGQDILQINGQVEADELALTTNQSVGVATIPVGQSGVNVTFTSPMIANPYIFLTHAGSPSGGPAKGNGQGTGIIGNVTPAGFTIALTDGDGITQVVADVDVVFMWLAVIPS